MAKEESTVVVPTGTIVLSPRMRTAIPDIPAAFSKTLFTVLAVPIRVTAFCEKMSVVFAAPASIRIAAEVEEPVLLATVVKANVFCPNVCADVELLVILTSGATVVDEELFSKAHSTTLKAFASPPIKTQLWAD
jgi:hypothetical protein